VVVVASDSGRPSTMGDHQLWQVTVVRESTVATTASMAVGDTTATTVTTVARFKRSEIQTHCFSTLDGICWTAF